MGSVIGVSVDTTTKVDLNSRSEFYNSISRAVYKIIPEGNGSTVRLKPALIGCVGRVSSSTRFQFQSNFCSILFSCPF